MTCSPPEPAASSRCSLRNLKLFSGLLFVIILFFASGPEAASSRCSLRNLELCSVVLNFYFTFLPSDPRPHK